MNFINNWMQPVTLAAGETALELDLADGAYRLTITDSATTPTRWEIVGATVGGGTAALARGLEGTLDQDWPAGSFIYAGLTAGMLGELYQRIASLEARVTELEPSTGLKITSANSGNAWGYAVRLLPGAPFGSLDPAEISVTPGWEAGQEVSAQLLVLAWLDEGSYQYLMLSFASPPGAPAELPFTHMQIGDKVFLAADAYVQGGGGADSINATWENADTVANPLPAGVHSLSFT